MTKSKGRHKEKRLTTATVRSIKEPGFYADGNGLYLKVVTSGARWWVQRLMINRKRRDIGLGSFSLISLAEAREIALQNRKLARSGGDPLMEKRQAAAVLTFEQAAQKVHDLHKPTWRNPKHAQQWINTLTEYAFPFFGNKYANEVTSADVLMALMPIWTHKPETARRVRQRIGVVMKWTIAQGWRQDNPAEAVTQALPKHDRSDVKHRKALPYDQVSNAIEKVKNSGAGQSTKLAFEFLVLTACRSGEVRGALWSEMNLDEAEWEIPAGRMKTKKPHRVPLSSRVLDLLKEAQNLSDDSDLVFVGTVRGKPLSDMTLSKLMKELKIDAVPHGFRSSFRDWASEQTNIPREVAEFALAHVIKNKSEAAYARSDLFEKRRNLMGLWANYCRPSENNNAFALRTAERLIQ